MRYVRHDQPPAQDWLNRAALLMTRLEQAPDDDARSTIIDDEASLYKELRDWLLAKSHGKCWFSEAKDLYSHWDVEHYRPKKKAKDSDGHACSGYWWLAFDWKNLRICGNVGNRKKGTYFPLQPGCIRATASCRTIDDEVPELLDPADPNDPSLIDFDEEGRIRASPAAVTEWDRARVAASSTRYKLDHEPLEQERRRIWAECRIKIDECDSAVTHAQVNKSIASRTKALGLMKEFRALIAPAAPLSRVVRSCLLASGKPWATQLVVSN